jgi:hypothetical protein
LSVDDPPNILSVTLGLGALLLHTVIDPIIVDSPVNRLEQIFPGVLMPLSPNPRPVTWPPPVLPPEQAWAVCECLRLLQV